MTKARDKILLAAQHCFAKAGVAGTNVLEIADAAGVARSSFYRHFRDIDDILLALATQLWTQQLRALGEKCSAIADPKKKWRKHIPSMVTMGTRLTGLSAVFAEDSVLHVVRLFYRDQKHGLTKITGELLPFIEQSKASGELRSDIDSTYIADWLLRQCWSLSSIPPAEGWNSGELDRYISTFILPSLLHPSLLNGNDSGGVNELRDEIQRLTRVITKLDSRIPPSR